MACSKRTLFPDGTFSSNCSNQFADVEISFKRLDGCCTNCHTQLQVDVIVDKESGPTSESNVLPAPDAPQCDSACDQIIGTYVVTQTGTGFNPQCCQRYDTDYCEYRFTLTSPITCSSRAITDIHVHVGIKNCLLDIVGAISGFDNVACFSASGDHHFDCEDNFDVTLPLCAVEGGSHMCDWSDVYLRIRSL